MVLQTEHHRVGDAVDPDGEVALAQVGGASGGQVFVVFGVEETVVVVGKHGHGLKAERHHLLAFLTVPAGHRALQLALLTHEGDLNAVVLPYVFRTVMPVAQFDQDVELVAVGSGFYEVDGIMGHAAGEDIGVEEPAHVDASGLGKGVAELL